MEFEVSLDDRQKVLAKYVHDIPPSAFQPFVFFSLLSARAKISRRGGLNSLSRKSLTRIWSTP
jgi:hypothetical protein